jgi:thiol-disulfide isomerase/thioredoxin
MRAACLALVVSWCCALSGAALGTATAGVPRELTAAEEAYKSNVAIGDSLAGKPATMEQVSDAESFYQEAVAQARRVLASNPGLAEAHHLLGLILCTGYRAAQVEAEQPQTAEAKKPRTVFVLLRGGEDCQEGLKELRAAVDLAKARYTYQVDYAGALLVCGDAEAAEKQARETWKLSLSSDDRANCARTLVECASAGNRTQEEIRWLREVVKYAPNDTAASQRLAKLAPPAPTAKPKTQNAIAWLDYETGMEQAEKQNKLVLAVFTASWCPTCRKLEKEVLQDRSVIAMSRQFICVKVDVDERVDVATKHAVSLLPTTLVLDSIGSEFLRLISFKSPEHYVAELKGALARAKETD